MPNPKILIIDDEPRMRSSLSVMLGSVGYEISISASGREALATLSDHEFDVVLLDLFMPEMNGFEVLEHLKRKHPNVPVLMMTGRASIQSAVEALKKGAFDYLSKPFEQEELLNRIDNALSQQRLKKEKQIISEKLELSWKRYRYLVHNSPDMIFTLDSNGRLMFANNTFRTNLGARNGKLVGRKFTSFVHTDEAGIVEHFLSGVRRGTAVSHPLELRFCRPKALRSPEPPDEDVLFVEFTALPMHDIFSDQREEDSPGIYCIARDVTAHRKAQQEKTRLESRLREAQKMEIMGILAGGLAHDFKNMLTVIQGNLSLLFSDVSPGKPNYEKLKAIERQVQSGAGLTEKLMGYARREQGSAEMQDLKRIIAETSETFDRTRRDISIRHRFLADLPRVRLSRGQSEQILLNLFINAADAMPGGGLITVETGTRNREELAARILMPQAELYVSVGVTDTGVGMDEETAKRIFDPFFTTKPPGRGTGLGLASVYSILSGNGGHIEVESQPGHGTTFTFYLPVPEEEAFQFILRGSQKSPAVADKEETVLLVDDEEIILEMGTALFRKMGYRVITAARGEKALEIYGEQGDGIDVVLLDVMMPGMKGDEVLRRLKAIDPRVRVILMSGFCSENAVKSLLSMGCGAFLNKPFRMNDLNTALRSVLS